MRILCNDNIFVIETLLSNYSPFGIYVSIIEYHLGYVKTQIFHRLRTRKFDTNEILMNANTGKRIIIIWVDDSITESFSYF